MENPLLSTIRHAGLFMRTVTGTVLVTFTMLVLAPTAMAAQSDEKRARQEALLAPTDEDELSRAVVAIEEKLKAVQARLAAGQGAETEKQALKDLRRKVEMLDARVMANFASVEKHIKSRNLSPIMLQRHRDAVAQYRSELSSLLAGLQGTEKAASGADFKSQIDKAEKRLSSRKLKRLHQPFDPNKLPHRGLAPTKERPKQTKEEFTRAGLFDTPYQKYAALGDFRYDKLVGAGDPAYLAETVEVKITQAVKDQAAALNHDPVKIYHWVRNNVEWIPSWGAIQDADHTLSSRRGNAMDIASLTIALLRASGVPARYVHGTIEVPEDKFRNWAGGFDNIEAASGFAASGGIPTTGIVSGGKIAKVQMEHIWVEAAIDYFPSRGAINRDADAWVELDPSFKQYEVLPGLDGLAVSGVDANAVGDSFFKSGTVNDSEGWVQGFDPTVVDAAHEQTKSAVETEFARLSPSTVAEVMGGRRTIVKEFPMLPSTLATKVVVKGTRYSSLPDRVRPRVVLGFSDNYTGEFNQSVGFAWAALNGRKVTLSFRPATVADEQALLSLLPQGEVTDVTQLPKSIPSYLIQVVPEIKVDGLVVLAGAAMRLGEDLPFAYSVTTPTGDSQVYPSPVVAGSYLSVAIIGGSVAPQRLNEVKARIEGAVTKLQSKDPGLMGSLSREDVLGDMFYLGTLGYFAEYGTLSQVTAQQQKSHFTLAPSAGTFGYVPVVSYFFGLPRSVNAGGVEMDLDRVAFAGNVDGKGAEAAFDFTFHLGALASYLEHSIPEQMFGTEADPVEGISAFKALQKARAQGQRIYHITAANQATALPSIHQNPETMSEIRSAIAAGKEVIVHTDPVSVTGWSGAGYVIYDAEQGDGAWKIGGGTNGGFLAFLTGAAQGMAIAALTVATLAAIAAGGWVMACFLMLLIFFFIPIILIEIAYADAVFAGDTEQQCLVMGRIVGSVGTTVTALFKNKDAGAAIAELVSFFLWSLWLERDFKGVSACAP